MNIFSLDVDPVVAAEMHCDKHVVKMILEYAQLLSTAHRILDGEFKTYVNTETGRERKFYLLRHESVVYFGNKPEIENPRCYRQSHIQHRCNVWARETDRNYNWLYNLFEGCLFQYTKRYRKHHAAERVRQFLSLPPQNISTGPQTPFAIAMPIEYRVEDAIESYKNFYLGEKIRFARWTNTEVPSWFQDNLPPEYASSNFARTR